VLAKVACIELPDLVRPLGAGEQALALFGLGDVEEELDDPSPGAPEVALPRDDVLEARLPERLVVRFGWVDPFVREKLGVDPDDKHLFVMGAVEDTDLAEGWERALRSPQEIVGELGRRGLLERRNEYALGIDATHDVLDRPILAGGIEALQHDQERVSTFSVETLL
jgi:hypothetical protein